ASVGRLARARGRDGRRLDLRRLAPVGPAWRPAPLRYGHERPGGRHGAPAAPGGAPAALASAAALRAFGAAAAVALVPRVIAETGIGWLGAALATGLATLALSRLARPWGRAAAGVGL